MAKWRQSSDFSSEKEQELVPSWSKEEKREWELSWSSEKKQEWESFWSKEKAGSGYDEEAVKNLKRKQSDISMGREKKVLERAHLTQEKYAEARKEKDELHDGNIEKRAKEIVQERIYERQNAPKNIGAQRLPVLLKLLAEGLLCYFVPLLQIGEFRHSANNSARLKELRKAQNIQGIVALVVAMICMGLVTLMANAVTIIFVAAAVISIVVAVFTRKVTFALWGIGGALISYPYVLYLRFIKGLPGGLIIWVVLSAVLFFVFDVLDLANKKSQSDEEQEIKAEEERLRSILKHAKELLASYENAENEVSKEEEKERNCIKKQIAEAEEKNKACKDAVKRRFEVEVWPAYLAEKVEQSRQDLKQAEEKLHAIRERQEAQRIQQIAELESKITGMEHEIGAANEKLQTLKEKCEELNKSRPLKEAEIRKAYDGKLEASAAEYRKREDEVRRAKEALEQELAAFKAEEQSMIDAATAKIEEELSAKRAAYEAELQPLLDELCVSGMEKTAGFNYLGAWACFHGMATNMLARPAIRTDRTIRDGMPKLQELSTMAAKKDAEAAYQRIQIDVEDSCFMPCHILYNFEPVKDLHPKIMARIEDEFTKRPKYDSPNPLEEFRWPGSSDEDVHVKELPKGLYKLRLLETGAKPVVIYYDVGEDSDERRRRENFVIGQLINTYLYCVRNRDKFHVDLVSLEDHSYFMRPEAVKALHILKEKGESFDLLKDKSRVRDQIQALSETSVERSGFKEGSLYERNVRLAGDGDPVTGPYHVLIVMNSDYKDLSDSGLKDLIQMMKNPKIGVYPILMMDRHYMNEGSKEAVEEIAGVVEEVHGVFCEYTEGELKKISKTELLGKLFS